MTGTPGPVGGAPDHGGSTASSRTRAVRAHPLLGPVATMVVAVLVAAATLAQVWSRYAWFDSVGATGVLARQTLAQLGLFAGAGLLAGGLVASSLVVADRTRPLSVTALLPGRVPGAAPSGGATASGARRRHGPFSVPGAPQGLEPMRRLLVVVTPVVVGVATGAAAASQWRRMLLWWHRRPFGTVDPLTGRDVGFFVFELPWWQLVTDLLLMALALAAVAAAAAHYGYGGLRLGPGSRSTRASTVHLALLLAALAALQAVRYHLDGIAAAVPDTSGTPGLATAVEHGVAPGKTILAAAALLVAVLFVVAAASDSWRLPAIGVAALALVALVVGSIYPAVVQGGHADDDEGAVAATARALGATRAAFGLRDARTAHLPAAPADARAALRGVALPLVDPGLVPQGAAGDGYEVRPPLSVLPSSCPGTTEVALGLRLPTGTEGSWEEAHRVRAHAAGVVARRIDAVDATGRPVAVSAARCLGLTREDAWFAPGLEQSAVVGSGGSAGDGGVRLSGPAQRLAHAIALHDVHLVSGAVRDDDRLLDVREPAARVARVAPWLRLDGETRPVVVDGRLVWTVVGYTTSSTYPGSMSLPLGGAEDDGAGDRARRVSYVRPAVIATVDGVAGHVHLYATDSSDPLLGAWEDAFPGAVEPLSDAPAAVRAGMRYPRDLFMAQQRAVARFHGTDAASAARTPAWVPGAAPTAEPSSAAWPRPTAEPQPTPRAGAARVAREPVSVTTTLPDQPATPALVATLATSANDRLAAVLAGTVAGGPAQEPRYRLTVLTPADSSGRTPNQVLAAMRSSTATAADSSTTLAELLASVGDGRGTSARLLTIPTSVGTVHVLPVWGPAPPSDDARLRAVVVACGDRIAWGATLDEALGRWTSTAPGARSAESRLALQQARAAMTALDRAVRDRDEAGAARARSALGAALDALDSALRG